MRNRGNMAKWHQKASVQTALVAGVFTVIIAMGQELLSLYQENQRLSRELSEKINNSIYTFSDNLNVALKKTAHLDLSPHLETFEGTMATMRALNQEASIYDSSVNLTGIYRHVREYGGETSIAQLGALINNYADSHQAANDYLLRVIKDTPSAKSASEYAALLNARSKARTALQTYIINLESNDFNI